jgi:hypothetical protein
MVTQSRNGRVVLSVVRLSAFQGRREDARSSAQLGYCPVTSDQPIEVGQTMRRIAMKA